MKRDAICFVWIAAIFLGIALDTTAQGHLVTTLSGAGPDQAPALAFGLGPVRSVALDSGGNLYIGSYNYNWIFKVDRAGTLTMAAGNGGYGFGGDGGPATEATILQAADVAVDINGNLFFAESVRVRRVDALTGIITTVAGGSYGFGGDGGPAIGAALSSPTGIALNFSGDLFIADVENHRIRKVDAATGIISTVAGTGNGGFNGDGLASNADLFYPHDVAVDASGNLLIADTRNQRVRRVDMATGGITTLAGNGTEGFDGDGGPAIQAKLANPIALAVDAADNVFVTDVTNHRVRRISAAGFITTVAGNGSLGCDGDGGPALAARIVPEGIAVDTDGNLFIADGCGRVRRVEAASGSIGTVAGNGWGGTSFGDGGPALHAVLAAPWALALTGAGDLLIADRADRRVRRVERDSGIITTVAGNGTGPSRGDGGPATEAGFEGVTGLAVDADDNIFVVDQGANKVRRVDAASGLITTVAGSGTLGFCGHERPALETCFYYPWAMTADSAGNLYVADTFNNRVALVDAASGLVTTIAGTGAAGFGGDGGPATEATLFMPTGVAVDPEGRHVYIADAYNQRVRRVDMATGRIGTFAGGGSSPHYWGPAPATSVYLNGPQGVALDAEGNLLVTGGGGVGSISRVVVATGSIYRVAGLASVGFAGDGGPALDAVFNFPTSVVADAAGNLFVADRVNHRVRQIANEQPVAEAGPDQTLESGTKALLNGSASFDSDMDVLGFEWRDDEGSVVGTAAVVEVIARGGPQVFTLTVSDGWGGRAVDKITVVGPITVDIDIKPNSASNRIRLRSWGNVPVAIFGSADFDVVDVDPATIALAAAPVALKRNGTPMAAVKDVNGDGIMDLVVRVSTVALQLSGADETAALEGRTFDGTPIRGEDSVRIVHGSR